MKTRTLVCLCGALAAWPLVEASAQAPALTPRDSALHALNRLAYGPRPGEVDRVAAAGVMQWIDQQLSPDKIDDAALAERERQFTILEYDAGELASMYVEAQREQREQKRQLGERGARLHPATGNATPGPAGVRTRPQLRPSAAVRPNARPDARGLATATGRGTHAEGHQRELRSRAARAAHTRRGRCLHSAGRDQRRANFHRLEHTAAPAGRGLRVPRLGPRLR